MNKKIMSLVMVVIGLCATALFVYQLNQYISTSATFGPTMSKLNSLADNPSSLAALGMSASDIEATKNIIYGTTSGIMNAAVLDVVIAVVFLAAGLLTYPNK